MSRRNRLAQQLRKQLGFLKRSMDAYDQGFTDEAIRIATNLRILFHDTKSQRSLLSQLGRPEVPVLTTVDTPHSGSVMFHGMGVIRLSDGTASLVPADGDGGFQAAIPASQWWQQLVFILRDGTRLTRRTIVLNAADKDGGAHVDPTLTPEYEKLIAFVSQKGGVVTLGGHGALGGKNLEVHLVALRQMAYEILHSPSLTALASDT